MAVRQWRRAVKIIVEGSSGEIDCSFLRARFEIKDTTLQSPRVASVRITNLSDATAQKIKSDGNKLTVEAGYENGSGIIFEGAIKQKRIGRETPTDTFMDLYAASWDRAYNRGSISKTLPSGSTDYDVYRAAIAELKKFGVREGQTPAFFKAFKYPRPYTMFGMVRDQLRTLAYSRGCTWNIRNSGQLDVIETDKALNGGATVLTARTGLIGMPVQTELGIIARCLINSKLGINSQVKIDQKSIREAVISLGANNGYGTGPLSQEPYLPGIAADGLYRIVSLNHVGDTHGQEWYCDLALTRLGAGLNEAQVNAGFGLPEKFGGPPVIGWN